MSRTWSTCSIKTHCGSCGGAINVGDPQQEITVAPERTLKRRPFLRCRCCADGEPPADLPAPVINRGAPVQPTALVPNYPGALPFDFKQAAAGSGTEDA